MSKFKAIPDLPGYGVSSEGKIYSFFYDKTLKLTADVKGYLYFEPYINGKKTKRSVHRTVAQVFLTKPSGAQCVNHLDANKQNNVVTNLEWTTFSKNILHANRLGLCRGNSKVISQYTHSGDFVRRYSTILEAAKAVGIKKNTLYTALWDVKRKSRAGGYTWQLDSK